MGGAKLLENWFPTQTGIRLRAGSSKTATIGSNAVASLMAYAAGNTRKLFATDDTSIYDVTNVADPDVAPTADVTGQSSGYYSSVMFGTAGGDFLYAFNGSDDPQLYDGTTWTAINDASTPAITGVTTSTLSQAWKYRSRLFMVEKDTMKAWYLPVDSVGGEATSLSLAGIFTKGGALLLGGTWSLDSGDGVDDKCVFVSTEGEVAIYEGSDPSSSASWALVGVYEIGKPLGKNATMRAGGDLLIATTEGIVPVSQALDKDKAALSLAAVTKPIAPEWTTEVGRRSGLPWEMVKWPTKDMGIITLPADTGQDQACLVVNLETGAWAKYTGWDTRCLVLHDDGVYFGTSDGKVMRAESTGSDDGSPYTCSAVLQFDHLRPQGAVKTMRMARTTFLASKPFNPKLSASVNYTVSLPSPPAAAEIASGDVWDTGLWDQAVWDAGSARSVSTRWVSIGSTGFTFALQVQVTCGTTIAPDAELVSIDAAYEVGAVVV